MASIADLLESELRGAFDVKDERSLHNYVAILTESIVRKEEYMENTGSMKSDIQAAVDSIREGFQRMDERFQATDKRFEAMDKRFDDLIHYSDKRFDDLISQMNSRFNMMFFFMTAGFTILTVLITAYQFMS